MDMEDSELVYITYYGEKYHIDKNCLYVKNKKINQITIKEAKNKNKLPCKGCCLNNINNNNNNKYIFNKNNKNNKNNNNINKNNQKPKYYYNNKQNEKKKVIKNFINSTDADDVIFNSTSILAQQNKSKESGEETNNIINENEIDNNEEKENVFQKEEKKSNIIDSDGDGDGDINQNLKKINNDLTDSNLYNNNISKNENNSDNSIEYNKKNKDILTDSNLSNNNISKNENNSNNSNEDNKKKKDLKINNKKENSSNTNDEINYDLFANQNKNRDINSKKIENLIEKQKNLFNKNYNFYDDNNKIFENQKSIDEFNYFLDSDDNNNIISKLENSSKIDNNTQLSQIIPEQISPNVPNFNYIEQYQLNQYNSLKKNNLLYNYNLKLNIQKNDMYILQNTYNNANTLSFGKSNLLHDNLDNNINGNGLTFKDSYMFKFEIAPLEQNNNNYIKIEVGFKVKYINTQDMNLIIDENLINRQKINIKIGTLFDSLKIKKNLIVFKYTGIVYALINIKLGKFFVVGKEELNKRKQNIFLNKTNTEIFFIKNFLPISNYCLKSIDPVFVFNKKDLKFFEIKINDLKIK